MFSPHLGNPIDSFGYQYDPLDRVSQFSSIDGTANYCYDKTSQLTSVVYAGGGHQPANESFQYDPNGNQTGPSPAGPNFTVGADNLLASDGTFNLFYDAEGNLIEKKRISTAPANDFDTKQTWDYRNRLTDVWQYNNSGVLTQHEHLVYDPFDRLIGRFIDSTGSGVFDHTELYVYDGSDVVLQFDGAGSLTNRYLNGPSPSGADQVYAEEDVTSLTSQGAVTWPLTDQQGSPHDIVDSNSVLEDHLIFKAFGQTAYESNPSIHHLEGYAGGLPDPVTGEIHFGARNLNAVDAVFTSQDPWDFGGGDTNESRYVFNSPTNYTDPNGTSICDDFAEWLFGGEAWGAAQDQERALVRELNRAFNTQHARLDQFTPAERAKIQERLGNGFDFDNGPIKGGEEMFADREVVCDVAETSLEVAEKANDAADVLSGGMTSAPKKLAREGLEAGAKKLAREGLEEGVESGGRQGLKRVAGKLDDCPPAKKGIYEFPDAKAGKKPYIGQSGDISKRLKQHNRSGRLPDDVTPRTTDVPGGKSAREVTEHKRIQEVTGGVPAKDSPDVANQRDPIGPKRRGLLDNK